MGEFADDLIDQGMEEEFNSSSLGFDDDCCNVCGGPLNAGICNNCIDD